MSAKWRRSLAWDDRSFPVWAWPAKAVLRAFSSIPMAVVLLLLVVCYGTVASVPAGVLVLALTQLFYGVTLLIAVVAFSAALLLIARAIPANRSLKFVGSVVAVLVGLGLGGWLWWLFAWPLLRYDPVSHSGVRFFASFVAQTQATT